MNAASSGGTVKAAVVRAPGQPLSIEHLTTTPIIANEVLVATRAVGLCHSDLHVLDGHLERPLPHLLGHEAAGVVVEVGDEVDSVQVGDHVVACLVVHCGSCRQCRSGRPTLCTNKEGVCGRTADLPPRFTDAEGTPVEQFSYVGALAEQMIVHHSAVTPISTDVPFDTAALLGCAVVTGVGAVEHVAEVADGDSVVVVGCGGVGLNIVHAARRAGAENVIGIDLDDGRRQLALDHFGATEVFDGDDPDVVGRVVQATDGGADHAFDVVGSPALTTTCLKMCAPGGWTYTVGIFATGSELVIDTNELHRCKGLVGVRMGAVNPQVDIVDLAGRYLAGDLPLDHLITDRIPLEEANAGFDRLRAVDGTRSVVVFDE